MRDWLAGNEIDFTHLRFFNKSHLRVNSAQLNIVAIDEERILESDFWPEGIFIKPWLSWNVFINSKHDGKQNEYY